MDIQFRLQPTVTIEGNEYQIETYTGSAADYRRIVSEVRGEFDSIRWCREQQAYEILDALLANDCDPRRALHITQCCVAQYISMAAA